MEYWRVWALSVMVSRLMEPSVSPAATILTSTYHTHCANSSTVYVFCFFLPITQSESFSFAFATGFKSTFAFPCSLWQGCREKKGWGGGCHGNGSFPDCGWIKLVTCSFPACDTDKIGKCCNAVIKRWTLRTAVKWIVLCAKLHLLQ